MNKKIWTLVLFVFLVSTPAFAAPGSSVRLIKKQNVVISLSGIKDLKSVNYELTYLNGVKEEGAVGTILPKKDTESRTIYLGTCSKEACTPHKNLKSGKVTIKFKTKAGVVTTKRYSLKF